MRIMILVCLSLLVLTETVLSAPEGNTEFYEYESEGSPGGDWEGLGTEQVGWGGQQVGRQKTPVRSQVNPRYDQADIGRSQRRYAWGAARLQRNREQRVENQREGGQRVRGGGIRRGRGRHGGDQEGEQRRTFGNQADLRYDQDDIGLAREGLEWDEGALRENQGLAGGRGTFGRGQRLGRARGGLDSSSQPRYAYGRNGIQREELIGNQEGFRQNESGGRVRLGEGHRSESSQEIPDDWQEEFEYGQEGNQPVEDQRQSVVWRNGHEENQSGTRGRMWGSLDDEVGFGDQGFAGMSYRGRRRKEDS